MLSLQNKVTPGVMYIICFVVTLGSAITCLLLTETKDRTISDNLEVRTKAGGRGAASATRIWTGVGGGGCSIRKQGALLSIRTNKYWKRTTVLCLWIFIFSRLRDSDNLIFPLPFNIRIWTNLNTICPLIFWAEFNWNASVIPEKTF